IGLVQIQGTIAGLPAPYPLQADFHLKFPDAAGLAALLGYPPRLQIQGPLSVEARLEMPFGNAYQWRRIDLRAGKSELSGDLLMDFSGVRPQIKTDLRLPLLDLPALLAPGGKAPNTKETDSEKPADIRKIIAGAVQPWARALQAVDIDADLDLEKMRFEDFEIHKLKIDGRLDQGNLQLTATSQSSPDVARKIGIEGLPDLGPVDLDLHAQASGNDLTLRSLELSAGIVEVAQINLQGKSRSLADPAEAELQFRIAGNDITALKPFFESFPDYEGAFRFAGRLESPEERRLRVDDAALQVGDSQMSGDLEFDLSGSRPEISATLKSPKLDLIPLALWLRPAPPPEIEPPAVVKSDRVIPDAKLPLETLKVIDGRLQLHADRILLPGLDMQNFKGEIRIQDGHVLADPVTFQSGEGSFEGRTVLRQVPDGAVISLNLRVEDIKLKALRSTGEIKSLLTGILNVEADLTGRGRSVSELLGSLDGRWVDIASDGRIANRYFAPFLLNPNVRGTILRSVNPAYKMQDYTEFNCRANQFEIEAGVTTWSGFLDTDLVYLAAGGTIDLSSERIDITANPRPKEGVGFQKIGQVTFNLAELTKPFKITGTLADPRIGLAPSRAVSTIAKALGGFLLLGPVGLAAAFADVSIGKDNSCIKALENFASSKEGSPPEKSSDENQTEKLTDEVKDWFDGEE
ncbi:MAG TPA: AsmA-like C-terminal region-containing protein, partial [Desulfobacterales bacterium]